MVDLIRAASRGGRAGTAVAQCRGTVRYGAPAFITRAVRTEDT
jgi:hypothetical protein